jgi:hypothetical protein
MGKKQLLVVALISLILLSTIAEDQFVKPAAGNWVPPYLGKVRITSPTNGSTYNASTVSLDLTFYINNGPGKTCVLYSLDNQPNSTIFRGGVSYIPTTFNVKLSDLANGLHTAVIYVELIWGINSENEFTDSVKSEVHFNVDVDRIPPLVEILTFKSNPLNKSETFFSFYANEPISDLYFTLNGYKAYPSGKSSFNQNQTIIGLPEGTFDVKFYATDLFGNVGTAETAITIPSPVTTPSPSPSPTVIPTIEPTVEPTSTPTVKPNTGFLGTNIPLEYGYAIVAVLLVGVAGASLLLYSRKRKKQTDRDRQTHHSRVIPIVDMSCHAFR